MLQQLTTAVSRRAEKHCEKYAIIIIFHTGPLSLQVRNVLFPDKKFNMRDFPDSKPILPDVEPTLSMRM